MSGFEKRSSKYPMMEVEDVLLKVIEQAGSTRIEDLPLSGCLGLRLAEVIVAASDFPDKPVSMMDGYAIKTPLRKGVHRVKSQIRAGDSIDNRLAPNSVAYITTGAIVPLGADAVVKVEDTTASLGSSHGGVVTGKQSLMDGEQEVNINVDVTTEMQNIREIGSDIRHGETVLKEGTVLGPVEVGLLATIGVTHVKCYRRPVVGVMSTGNELVDATFEGVLPSGKIRDSNRAALLAAFAEDGYLSAESPSTTKNCCHVSLVDLGIAGDTTKELQNMMKNAMKQCDVVITSGGVSMGDADLVKPLLEELGTVHVGRVNMKPGKPTTFATIKCTPDRLANETGTGAGDNRTVLFFGLPGNPVSCLVTKTLFVDPALRRLQGEASDACLHVQTKARLSDGFPEGSDHATGGEKVMVAGLKLDQMRPEYHRGVLELDVTTGQVIVKSTGAVLNARSSRLLSMRASNSLICLPQGTKDRTMVPFGSMVDVLLPRGAVMGLSAPTIKHSLFPKAAHYDENDLGQGDMTSLANLDTFKERKQAEEASEMAEKRKSSSKIEISEGRRTMRVALLTISDRASEGVYADASGPAMQAMLESFSVGETAWPLDAIVAESAVVPDEVQLIRNTVCKWCDAPDEARIDVILSSGGTGFGLRDSTPEAISSILHRQAPGVAQALLNEGLNHTPLAVLSRPVAGTRNKTFVATLPGSVKAVKENMRALKPLLPRIVELLQENKCD